MKTWSIIIHIPAYNAGTSLPELLERCERARATLSTMDAGLAAIIIVNDGSTDNTAAFISKSKKNRPYLKFIDKKTNAGPVSAIFDGMGTALELVDKPDKTIIVRMDADLEHQPEDLERLVAPIMSGKTRIAVGYVPFDSRNGFLVKLFNESIGLRESRKFVGVDIPQFCPGFNAIRGDLFQKISPLLRESATRFKERYGNEMLTVDLVTLAIAGSMNETPAVIKLSPIENRWVKKQPLSKLMRYLDYHFKNVEFLEKELHQMPHS